MQYAWFPLFFLCSAHVISLIDPALSVSSHTSNPQEMNMDVYQHDIQDMPNDFNDAMANHATSQSNVRQLSTLIQIISVGISDSDLVPLFKF